MKLKFSILATSLVFASFVQASPLEDTFKQANEAFKAGNFDKAGDLFLKAGDLLTKKDINQASMIWGNAALAKVQAGKCDKAIDIYDKIFKSKQTLPIDKTLKFHTNKIICRGKLENFALQSQDIDTLLKFKKKLPAPVVMSLNATRGDALRKMELYSLAIDSYVSVLNAFPKGDKSEDKAKVLTALGLCQRSLGLYDAAEKNLNEALIIAKTLKQDETIANGNSLLGLLALDMGDYVKALKLLNTAISVEQKAKLERNIGVDKNNLALVSKSMGNMDQAMKLTNESIEIAKKISNKRDLGIAYSNRALLYRISGDFDQAARDYNYSLSLFKEVSFKEGTAGAELGVGKMLLEKEGNYADTLEHYNKALNIYHEIENFKGETETIIQLAYVYKDIAQNKKSATRDLVFEDDESSADENNGKIPKEEAIQKVKELASKSLENANTMHSKAFTWASHQLLGFACYSEGDLESAFNHYEQSIDIVNKVFLTLSEVEVLGEYMAGKEDLYTEAQEVCAGLYDKTKDIKYQQLMLKYGETLRNEIQKASASLAQLHFEDKSKQGLYDELSKLGKAKKTAEAALPVVKDLPKDATPEQKAQHELEIAALENQKKLIKKLDGDFEKNLASWKKDYPGDSVLFDSASRIDVPTIQENISDGQSVLVYTMIPNKLFITAISNKEVNCVSVDVKKAVIEKLIKDDFLVNGIEVGARELSDHDAKSAENETLKAQKVLSELYSYLIAPIEDKIGGQERLYIVSDGFLAQTPFSALISNGEDSLTPEFLVEKYDIAYVRPSFINSLAIKYDGKSIKKLLGIGNPSNDNFPMKILDGTASELANANKKLSSTDSDKDIAVELVTSEDEKEKAEKIIKAQFDNVNLNKPTEKWVRDRLASNKYELLYFATHGMPQSNTYASMKEAQSYITKKFPNLNIVDYVQSVQNGANPEELLKAQLPPNYKKKINFKTAESNIHMLYMDKTNLGNNSPLNGFLLLSNDNDDVFKNDIQTDLDGLLTIKEITQMPDEYFKNTQFVVLSACNTGVSFVPKALKENLDEDATFNSKDVEQSLRDQGWVPGVDQIGFVDTFMRRGIRNVYGTMWFADDAASSYLMSNFSTNLAAQTDKKDAVKAFNDAQRSYISACKSGNKPIDVYTPIHPYYWSVGAMFGK